MLYDLEKDKDKNRNVVDRPAYREVAGKLNTCLKEVKDASSKLKSNLSAI